MSVTVSAASAFIGISDEEPILPDLLNVADAMVTEYLRPSGERRIPGAVRDHAVKVLTGELWQRRNSPAGVASWSADGQTPIRLALDTLKAVRPILDPYRGYGGIG